HPFREHQVHRARRVARRVSGGLEARPMRWQDIEALVRLEQDLCPADAWAESSWWRELAGRPRRDYVVLEDGAGVLAYAGLHHGGEVADVMTVAVARRAQGTGVGAALVAELEARAVAGGAAYVMLEVRDDNEPAKNLYARRGFEVLTVRRRYYQPDDVDAVIMRKTLAAAA
ncbi:MAG: ribosomal protein S18-alanine N-acetyltransferase, partial [Nostocoides sp.]